MSNHNTINHFSHNHPLTEVNDVGSYTCNGCKLYGEGKTYRCSDCDYDLHEYCATCPSTLRNSWHGPDHELSLINGPANMTERGCYVCRVYIQGMFYKCKHCTFESHPLCTQGGLMHASSPDATITKQRSLHNHAGQASSLHHYGYAHMGPYGAYPYGGYHHYHYHYHQHQHQHHHQQHQHDPYMKPDSPKADSSKGKKKKGGVMEALATVGTSLLVATITDSFLG